MLRHGCLACFEANSRSQERFRFTPSGRGLVRRAPRAQIAGGELPRDVLTREGLEKFVPGALSAYSARYPRWWWPFGHE